MKIKKIKIFILCCLIVLSGTFLTGKISAQTKQEIIIADVFEKNKYESQVSEKVENLFKNELNGEYPSYYGGMYIDNESSNLIIQIVKRFVNEDRTLKKTIKKEKEISVYESLSNIDKTIKFEYVDNSYEELNAINDKIINYFSNNNLTYTNLVGNYVDVYSNSVIVELKDNSELEQRKFKDVVVNSDLIQFIEKEENITTATTLKAGQGIPSDITPNFCSVGYRVKVNGKEGYITAGHCVKGLNSIIYTGKATKYQFSGKVDAAFIEVNSSYTVSNSLRYYLAPVFSISTSSSSPKLTVGTKVAKSGVTTNYTYGKVVNNNYSSNVEGAYLTNMILTDVKADSGDSGGPVYIPGNNGGTVLGIVSGRNKSSVNSMFFTQESNIYASFKYTRW